MSRNITTSQIPPCQPISLLLLPYQADKVMIIRRVFENLSSLGAKPSLRFEQEKYTYQDLREQVSGICTVLREYVSPGGRVGVITGNDTFTYASLLACWALRCAYVPLNLKNPINRLNDQIEQAELSCILTSETLSFLVQIPVLKSSALPPTKDALVPLNVQENDLAYLLFTSGSTGRPKGVPIYHRNLNAFLEVIVSSGLYDFNADDRFLQMFELTFDLSVFSWCVPLCIGAETYVIPDKGVSYLNISTFLEDYDITVALMVPSVLSYLRRYFDEIRLPALRWSLFCGEALSADVIEEWARCVPNAILENVYGPTEATIFCTHYRISLPVPEKEQHNGIVSIGEPFPNMQCIIVNEQGISEPIGKSGELCLVGRQVTDAYWRNTPKTLAAFVEIPGFGQGYKTGDICIETTQNHFNYVGRADFQLKIDGYRVESGEIEHHVRNYLRKPAIVVTLDENKPILTLVVESDVIDTQKLIEYLQMKLPDYMIPKKIFSIEKLPTNLNGKIDRKAVINWISQSIT